MPQTALEIAVVVLFALGFATLGVLHTRGRVKGIEDFITARGSMGLGVGVATIAASVLGAWILFSPAESATFAGVVGVLGYAVGQAAPFVAFAVVGPRMRALMPQGHSLTEYVWFRYGRAMYGAVLAIMVFYMFVFLAAELTAIALAVNLVAGVPLWATALVLGATTVAYTTYGGLKASIFTDSIQALFIFPLLVAALVTAVVGLGGLGEIGRGVSAAAPQLLSWGHRLGIETAVGLVVAILAANLFHQGYWQRVYACRDDTVLRGAFLWGALAVIPAIFLAGAFGLMAVGAGVVEVPSVALFSLILAVLPEWAILVVLVLAVALVMSSVDTLLNGIVSVLTADLHRLRPALEPGRLLRTGRWATVALAGLAVLIASQGYSVLYLFLIADLVCAAALVPAFAGLYSRRLSGGAAVASFVLGLAVGTLFFPTPSFAGWLPIPYSGSLMVSFLAALALSGAATLLLSRRGPISPGRPGGGGGGPRGGWGPRGGGAPRGPPPPGVGQGRPR